MQKKRAHKGMPQVLQQWLTKPLQAQVREDFVTWLSAPTPAEIEAWAATYSETQDDDGLLADVGWVRPCLPGDLVVAEITFCEDPLCGSESVALVIRHYADGLGYYYCSQCDQAGGEPLCLTTAPLSTMDTIQLLERTHWLDSNITLDALDIDSSDASKLFGVIDGDFPLLSIESIYSEIPPAFYRWIEDSIKRKREQ